MKTVYLTETGNWYFENHIFNIDIEINNSYLFDNRIVASSEENIKKRLVRIIPKKPEWQLEDYDIKIINACINDVIVTLESRGFNIQKEYQSHNSYSYYIEFYPKGLSEIDQDDLFLIKLRISNHTNEDYPNEFFEYHEKSNMMFRSIIVNDISHKDNVKREDLVDVISNICKLITEYRYYELTNDEDIFDKLYKKFL